MAKSILEHFAELPGPRMERTKLYMLGDIVSIAICAVICGAEGWTDIELFGKSKQSWFKTFIDQARTCHIEIFGKYFEDRWSEMKLGLWIFCGGIAGTGVYFGLTKLFG